MTYENAVEWMIEHAPFSQFTDYDDFYDNFVREEPTFSDKMLANSRFNDILEREVRKKKPEWFDREFEDTTEKELEKEQMELDEILQDDRVTKEELKEVNEFEKTRGEAQPIRPSTRDITREQADTASRIPPRVIEREPQQQKPKVSLSSKIKSAFRRLFRR